MVADCFGREWCMLGNSRRGYWTLSIRIVTFELDLQGDAGSRAVALGHKRCSALEGTNLFGNLAVIQLRH